MTRRTLLMALVQSGGEAQYQSQTFNAFAKAYNLVVQKATLGEWPLRDLKAVQRRWCELQALPGWPKEKSC